MKNASFTTVACTCGTKVKVDSKTTAVTCHMCVTKMVGIEIRPKPQDDEAKQIWRRQVAEKKAIIAARKEKFKGFPRGWWFKAEFTAPDGRVFRKGQEVK